jgi:hypothetical protein
MKTRPKTSEPNFPRFTERCPSLNKKKPSENLAYQVINYRYKPGLLLLGNLVLFDRQQNDLKKAEIKKMIVERNDEILGLIPAFATSKLTKKNEAIKIMSHLIQTLKIHLKQSKSQTHLATIIIHQLKKYGIKSFQKILLCMTSFKKK